MCEGNKDNSKNATAETLRSIAVWCENFSLPNIAAKCVKGANEIETLQKEINKLNELLNAAIGLLKIDGNPRLRFGYSYEQNTYGYFLDGKYTGQFWLNVLEAEVDNIHGKT